MFSTVIAAPVTPALPSWINSQFVFGVLLAIVVVLVLVGAIKMLPDAHKANTGKVAGGLLNYVIIVIFIVLVIGGGLIAIATTGSNELFNVK